MSHRLQILPIIALGLALGGEAFPQSTRDDSPANRADEVVTVPEFQVTGSQQRDTWLASQAMSGTRTAAPLIELPYQVQVLTQEFLDDFKLLSVGEQLSFFSGYSSDSNLSDAAINFTAAAATFRGFPVTIIRDGFRRTPPPQIGNIYQVEVIKGPISTLYGVAQPGGLVNYVSKRPSTRPEYKVSVSAGSYNYRLGNVTASGPLYRDKLFYLLSVENYYRESNYQYVYSRNGDYSLTLLWKPTPGTSVSIQGQMQRLVGARAAVVASLVTGTTRPVSNPLAWTGGTITGIYRPFAENGLNPFGPNEHYHRDYDGVNLLVEHVYNSAWKQRFAYQWFDKDFVLNYRTTSNLSAETMRFTNIFPRTRIQHYKAPQAYQTDLLGHFSTGAASHALLFTADYSKESLLDNIKRLPAAEENALPTSIRYADPYNPDWFEFDYNRMTRLTTKDLEQYEFYGSSLSDRVSLAGGKVMLMGNLRYDHTRQGIDTSTVTASPAGGAAEAWTYSYGANWRLAGDALVLFANHSTSFNTNVTLDQGTGTIIPNERGKGTEFGFKSLAMDQRLGLSVSAFRIEKSNIGQANPDYQAGNGLAQFLGAGVERVQGLDSDFSYRLAQGFTVLGSIGYLDGTVTQSTNATLVGTRKTGIPRLTSSVAARYNFEGRLRGFSVGASLRYTGGFVRAYASSTRLYEEGGPVQIASTFVKYSWRQAKFTHTAALNGNNLFDKLYVGPGGSLALGRQVNFSYSLSYR